MLKTIVYTNIAVGGVLTLFWPVKAGVKRRFQGCKGFVSRVWFGLVGCGYLSGHQRSGV
jgi:hypothetical protein